MGRLIKGNLLSLVSIGMSVYVLYRLQVTDRQHLETLTIANQMVDKLDQTRIDLGFTDIVENNDF